MLISGVELMMVGMGIVFLFLAMLVFAVHILSKLIERYIVPSVIVPSSKSVTADHGTLDSALVAAITAAVHQYRKDRV
jgi:sodium pump decarboxylases, gamma subunit